MAFESLTQDSDGVTAAFRNRTDDTVHEIQADVLIGADGIHSAVRKNFYPERDEFRFSGRILWRAVTYTQAFLDGRTMFMAGYQAKKFVAYPIKDEAAPKGTATINWIAGITVGASTQSSHNTTQHGE